MSTKSNSKRQIAPTHRGPVPTGTALYRALHAVAQAVAAKLTTQQRKTLSQTEVISTDADKPSG